MAFSFIFTYSIKLSINEDYTDYRILTFYIRNSIRHGYTAIVYTKIDQASTKKREAGFTELKDLHSLEFAMIEVSLLVDISKQKIKLVYGCGRRFNTSIRITIKIKFEYPRATGYAYWICRWSYKRTGTGRLNFLWTTKCYINEHKNPSF